jgi:undecaprenyl-diphosphatase
VLAPDPFRHATPSDAVSNSASPERPASRRPAFPRADTRFSLEDQAMQPPVWESVVLGAIQGLTEFLPVSSDGHLALAEMLFDFKSKGLALNVMLHLGTLLATLVMLWSRVKPAVEGGLIACVRPSALTTLPGARDALVVVLATLPTAAVGFGLRQAVERWTESPLVIGLGFLGTSAALIGARFARPGALEQPGVLGALLIGLAQGLAVLPGLSRSASTIAVALLLGVKRERAFELSMLMSLPAVLGAMLLEAPQAFAETGLVSTVIVGSLVAFLVGILSLGLLRRIVVAGAFSWFAAWVLPIALATLALAQAWPHP